MSEGDLRSLSGGRVFLAHVLEILTRLGGWTAAVRGIDREGAEAVIRGRLLGGAAHWRIGRNVRFIGPVGRFKLGDRVCLYGDTILNANGPRGFVSIGSDTHVDYHTVLYGQGGLTIGRLCAIAAGVVVYSQSNADQAGDGTPVALQPVVYATVTIGDSAWLGAGVRVLPGVTIGDGAHIGAGAVLLESVPPHSVVVGVPGRVVRSRLPAASGTAADTPATTESKV